MIIGNAPHIIWGLGLGLVGLSHNPNYFYAAAGGYPLLFCDGSDYRITDGAAIVFPTKTKTANAITGTPEVGETLTTDDGGWSVGADVYYYQWGYEDDDFVAIDGETNNTYVVVADDLGHIVTCRVWAGDSVASYGYYLTTSYHTATGVEIV